MLDLTNRVLDNVFPEERNRALRFLRDQRRNLRVWLAVLLAIPAYFAASGIETIVPYLFFHAQTAVDLILFLWLVVLVVAPFVWPQEPGDFFREDFKRGLDPRTWEYDGDWKVELDERGSSVLTVIAWLPQRA